MKTVLNTNYRWKLLQIVERDVKHFSINQHSNTHIINAPNRQVQQSDVTALVSQFIVLQQKHLISADTHITGSTGAISET